MAPDTVFCVASLNERWHLALILSERANDKWGTGDVKASMLRLLISFAALTIRPTANFFQSLFI
jgi:hypothetical protein